MPYGQVMIYAVAWSPTLAFVGTDVLGGPRICNFEIAENDYALPRGSQETPTAGPLVDLLPPKGRGAKAEINLAIVSDSLPLGTPSLTAKPKLLVISDPA